MATPAKATDYSQWPTRLHAAAQLGVHEKTIQRYVNEGKLNRRHREDGITVFSPAEIAALIKVREARAEAEVLPVERTRERTSERTSELVRSALDREASVFEQFCRAIELFTQQQARPVYISRAEAVRVSGLSGQTIADLAATGAIKTMPYGKGRRYRRADVEAL